MEALRSEIEAKKVTSKGWAYSSGLFGVDRQSIYK
jgi:hypothetical protein